MSRAAFDVAGLLRQAARLGRTAAELAKVKQRATGTLRRRMPVEARRDIQGEYALSAARINAGLTAVPIDGGVEVRGSSRGVGLRQFNARQTRAGVSYSIKRGERDVERGAFIRTPAKYPASGEQVFVRKYQGGRRVGRYPLVREYGPQIAQMLRRPDRRERLADLAAGIGLSELDRLIGGQR